MQGIRTPREEIAFTARPKFQSQIFRYVGSIFCLPHRPNFSDILDLYLHWVSVVRALDYEFLMQIVSRMLWKNKIKNALSLTKLMDANDPKFQQIKELLLCPIGFRMRKLRCSMWQSSGHCPCLLPLLLLSSELWHRKSTDGTLYRLTLISG